MSKQTSVWELGFRDGVETAAPLAALSGGDGRTTAKGAKGGFAGLILPAVQLKAAGTNQSLSADQLVGGLVNLPRHTNPADTIELPSPSQIFEYLSSDLLKSKGPLEAQFGKTTYEEPSAQTQSFDCTIVTAGDVTWQLVLNGCRYYANSLSDAYVDTQVPIGANSATTLRFFPWSTDLGVRGVAVVAAEVRRGTPTSTEIQDWEDVLELDPVSGPHTPTISDGQQVKFQGGLRVGGLNLDTGTTNTNGIAIGAQASALNAGTAVGGAASAGGTVTTMALGNSASTGGSDSVAVGSGAQGLVGNTVAVGSGATASQNFAVALGNDSTAGHTQSVAVGANVSTTSDNQVRLGTASHTVSVPGKFQMPPLVAATDALLPSVPTFAGPPNSAPPDGSVMVDTAGNLLWFRSGGAWVSLPGGGGGQDLNNVLTVGNTTGGADIVMSGADNIWTKYQVLSIGSAVGTTLNANQLLDTSMLFRNGQGMGQTDTLPAFAVLDPLMELNGELTWRYWNASSNSITLAAGASNEIVEAGSAVGAASMVVPANTVASFQMVKKALGVTFYNTDLAEPANVGSDWATVLAAGNTSGGTNPQISNTDQIVFLGPALVGTSGNAASGTGGNAIAFGGNTNAALAGVAVGAFSSVSADLGVAVGNQAQVLHDSSAAFGPLTQTTETLEVRLGADTTFVSCPTYIESGKQERLRLTDTTTIWEGGTNALDITTLNWTTVVFADKRTDLSFPGPPPIFGVPLVADAIYYVHAAIGPEAAPTGVFDPVFGEDPNFHAVDQQVALVTADLAANKTIWGRSRPYTGSTDIGPTDYIESAAFVANPGYNGIFRTGNKFEPLEVEAIIFTPVTPVQLFVQMEAVYRAPAFGGSDVSPWKAHSSVLNLVRLN